MLDCFYTPVKILTGRIMVYKCPVFYLKVIEFFVKKGVFSHGALYLKNNLRLLLKTLHTSRKVCFTCHAASQKLFMIIA